MLEGERGRSAESCPSSSVTVVLCAYTQERWVTLRHAIDAALQQIARQDELLVIIDHNDTLLARCREHLGDLVVLPNRHNRGLSGARNTALDKAQGAIVVFLDDDAIPLEGWLDALRAPYADEQVYGVGGIARPRWFGAQPKWFPDEFLWVVGCSHRGLPADSHPVRNLVGANMSFRKCAFEHVGGFTEELGRTGEQLLGCEETEFSIRLSQANPNAIILYEPASQVEHHLTAQRASLSYFIRRCWAEGISKAEVARRVGRSTALSTERDYVLRVLPRGVWAGLHATFTGDPWGWARATSIIVGLVTTAVGYCIGTVYSTPSTGKEGETHAEC